LLADIRCIKGAYNSENIIKAVIFIIKKMISIKQLGFFITDNTIINDTAVRAILIYLLLKLEDFNFRRIKCLKHIINLAAKAFLFEKDADVFKKESKTKKKLLKLKIMRELYRKKDHLKSFITLLISLERHLKDAKPF
jgi:hypothetical protein